MPSADLRLYASQCEPLDEQTPLLDVTQRSSGKLEIVRSRSPDEVRAPCTSQSSEGPRAHTGRQGQGKGEFELTQHSALSYDQLLYEQFTCEDWGHHITLDTERRHGPGARNDYRNRLRASWGGIQDWLLVAIIGIATAFVAALVNSAEVVLFDYKFGYCSRRWSLNKKHCCPDESTCEDWSSWADLLHNTIFHGTPLGFLVFATCIVLFSIMSCYITLLTRTITPLSSSLRIADGDLSTRSSGITGSITADQRANDDSLVDQVEPMHAEPVGYYPAAGSGVAELRVILSGFNMHGYLGLRTLVCKVLGLIFSMASGLTVGQEGPFVHIGTCIAYVVSNCTMRDENNESRRQELLNVGAGAGFAAAFSAPIAGALFCLEQITYHSSRGLMFKTFFCCVMAALTLKSFDMFQESRATTFQSRTLGEVRVFEVIAAILLGFAGGALGALFVKASRTWAIYIRGKSMVRSSPVLEVMLVAMITALSSPWSEHTRLPSMELTSKLTSSCEAFSNTASDLCPTREHIPEVVLHLSIALVIKVALTVITFGIKVPAGIYVPSMCVGALVGRITGLVMQWLMLTYPGLALFGSCSAEDSFSAACIDPSVYALVAAGATMTGVTRLQMTLVVLLCELTGSLQHALYFAIGILFAKWTADAIEPLSIYDLLTDMNEYPYLDPERRPATSADLGDIMLDYDTNLAIDISASPLVLAETLRTKFERSYGSRQIDGGIPIVRGGVLVGLIATSDMAHALDGLLIATAARRPIDTQVNLLAEDAPGAEAGDLEADFIERRPLLRGPLDGGPIDLTGHIDRAPITLDISSGIDQVFDCFTKLGVRYIGVSREGRFVGVLHKKVFIGYVKTAEREVYKSS